MSNQFVQVRTPPLEKGTFTRTYRVRVPLMRLPRLVRRNKQEGCLGLSVP